jgi:hypothetical protein
MLTVRSWVSDFAVQEAVIQNDVVNKVVIPFTNDIAVWEQQQQKQQELSVGLHARLFVKESR